MNLLGSYLSEIKRSPDLITGRARAEAHLLYANWSELTSYYDSEYIQKLFLEVNLFCQFAFLSSRSAMIHLQWQLIIVTQIRTRFHQMDCCPKTEYSDSDKSPVTPSDPGDRYRPQLGRGSIQLR